MQAAKSFRAYHRRVAADTAAKTGAAGPYGRHGAANGPSARSVRARCGGFRSQSTEHCPWPSRSRPGSGGYRLPSAPRARGFEAARGPATTKADSGAAGFARAGCPPPEGRPPRLLLRLPRRALPQKVEERTDATAARGPRVSPETAPNGGLVRLAPDTRPTAGPGRRDASGDLQSFTFGQDPRMWVPPARPGGSLGAAQPHWLPTAFDALFRIDLDGVVNRKTPAPPSATNSLDFTGGTGIRATQITRRRRRGVEDSDYNRLKAEMAETRRGLNGAVAVVDDVKESQVMTDSISHPLHCSFALSRDGT